MSDKKDIDWFKNEIASKISGYEIIYKFFSESDFGPLNQVEFNSNDINCAIDFWDSGRLSIFIWDCKKEKEILNVFLEPNQYLEKENAFKELRNILAQF